MDGEALEFLKKKEVQEQNFVFVWTHESFSLLLWIITKPELVFLCIEVGLGNYNPCQECEHRLFGSFPSFYILHLRHLHYFLPRPFHSASSLVVNWFV
jgi:hypothetical protein